jgi:hypothetical protein
MRWPSLAALGLLLLGTCACARTVYRHLEPAAALAPTASSSRRLDPSHHLRGGVWLAALLPLRVGALGAGDRRGGRVRRPGNVREIRTEQSFAQGLLYVLTSYYLTIYAPYTGEVVCAGDRR